MTILNGVDVSKYLGDAQFAEKVYGEKPTVNGILNGNNHISSTNTGYIGRIFTGPFDDTIINDGLTGSASSGAGNDLVYNWGTIGPCNLGSGKDYYYSNGITGSVLGGEGDDTVMLGLNAEFVNDPHNPSIFHGGEGNNSLYLHENGNIITLNNPSVPNGSGDYLLDTKTNAIVPIAGFKIKNYS